VAGRDILANSRTGAERNAGGEGLLNKTLFKDYAEALSLYGLVDASVLDKVSRRTLSQYKSSAGVIWRQREEIISLSYSELL
jgi:hypothetical protein